MPTKTEHQLIESFASLDRVSDAVFFKACQIVKAALHANAFPSFSAFAQKIPPGFLQSEDQMRRYRAMLSFLDTAEPGEAINVRCRLKETMSGPQRNFEQLALHCLGLKAENKPSFEAFPALRPQRGYRVYEKAAQERPLQPPPRTASAAQAGLQTPPSQPHSETPRAAFKSAHIRATAVLPKQAPCGPFQNSAFVGAVFTAASLIVTTALLVNGFFGSLSWPEEKTNPLRSGKSQSYLHAKAAPK